MPNWSFYGRGADLQTLRGLLTTPRCFFCCIQGRRRIGKTALLAQLVQAEASLSPRLFYLQIPDSDERDVVTTFARTLEETGQAVPLRIIPTVTDFASMAAAIAQLCRAGFVVVLDEFQYFTRTTLRAFPSFLQAQVDRLRDTDRGGLIVLGSLQAEMESLLDDRGAPLFRRLTHQRHLGHWDFQDLQAVFRDQGVREPA